MKLRYTVILSLLCGYSLCAKPQHAKKQLRSRTHQSTQTMVQKALLHVEDHEQREPISVMRVHTTPEHVQLARQVVGIGALTLNLAVIAGWSAYALGL